MARTKTVSAVVVLAALVGIAVAGSEQKVSQRQVPTAVRKALKKLAGSARITEIERETKNGIVFYEGEWSTRGRETGAMVTAEGDLVELEEEIGAKDVPARVKAAVAKEFPGARRFEYEKVMVVMYEVEARIGGREMEILVLPTGKIVGKAEDNDDDDDDDDDADHDEGETRVSLDDLPTVVKATILAQAKGATVREIERVTRRGRTFYEAEWIENGREVEIKVAPDGRLLKKKTEARDDNGDDD